MSQFTRPNQPRAKGNSIPAPLDHSRAPILEKLRSYGDSGPYPFHTPGHKGGRFTAPELTELWGEAIFKCDLPGMTATDNTFHPAGCILEAQELASDLFGARETFFLSAGSTLGVATAMLAAVPPGETIVVPRNIHRSVVAAMVLSGARPRFVANDVLPECGALGVSTEALVAALDAVPKPAAVLLTRPSYYGVCRDLTAIVAACHKRGVPLIIDEAHGAHLHFLPPGGPTPALVAGADLVIQSCHKTTGAMVGSAQLHVSRESLVAGSQIRDAINLLQTTSPNFPQLASIDATRRWLHREGPALFAEAVQQTRQLADEIDALPGIRVLRADAHPKLAGHGLDPLRLVVNVSGAGWTGYDVELHLRHEAHVEDEMSDWFNVVYIMSPHDDEAARSRLLAGLRWISEHPRPISDNPPTGNLLQPPAPPLAMLPRDAALARKEVVPLQSAAGRASAEMVMFYPPGIPLLMPGELITEETLAVCRQLHAAGGHLYASDDTLQTVRVVAL